MMHPVLEKVNKYAKPLSAVSISIWALYLRFRRLAEREWWTDEIFQMSQTVGPFKPIWKRVTYGDFTCFPGDYLLTYPFTKISETSKWVMAIPHIIATIIGLFFLYLLCRRHFKTFIGYIVTFGIICFNQHLIFHSFELRPYAVLATLAIISCYSADVLVAEYNSMTRCKKVLIGIFYIFTTWFHAFGVVIALLPLIFFTISRKNDPDFKTIFKRMFVFTLITFSIAFPLWLWYATGNPINITKEENIKAGRLVFQFIPNPMTGFWHSFNRIVFYNLIGFKRLYFLLGGLVLLVFVPFAEKLKKLAFFLILVILPIEMTIVAALNSGYWFLIRQYIHTAPLFAFFLGLVWDSSFHFYLDRENKRFTPVSIVGLILMIGCSTAGIIGIILNA